MKFGGDIIEHDRNEVSTTKENAMLVMPKTPMPM
jgi:hypothetical protein